MHAPHKPEVAAAALRPLRVLNEDTLTQAVMACHAQAPDARLRELMTSLVQHLHAFARESRLGPAELAGGIAFLRDAVREGQLPLLADVLGLSALVAALDTRLPAGCTPAMASSLPVEGPGPDGQPCVLQGQVRALDGTPLPGARLQAWAGDVAISDAHGHYRLASTLAAPRQWPDDAPVARLLRQLGRPTGRPAHLRLQASAPGCQPLATEVYGDLSPHLATDAALGARDGLLAHARPADAQLLDFDVVLQRLDTLPCP